MKIQMIRFPWTDKIRLSIDFDIKAIALQLLCLSVVLTLMVASGILLSKYSHLQTMSAAAAAVSSLLLASLMHSLHLLQVH